MFFQNKELAVNIFSATSHPSKEKQGCSFPPGYKNHPFHDGFLNHEVPPTFLDRIGEVGPQINKNMPSFITEFHGISMGFPQKVANIMGQKTLEFLNSWKLEDGGMESK